jgi:hypothetical protein
MHRTLLLTAIVGAVALSGCILERRNSGSHASGGSVTVGTSVEIEHSYTYFPSHHAYHCDSCDDWWVIEAGVWTHRRERPRSIVIRDDTPWVVVDVRDAKPHLRHADHRRDYPDNWNPGKSKGPPPGRGWRK